VDDVNTFVDQNLCDKESAMTMLRILLTAHDRDAASLNAALEPLYPIAEIATGRDPAVKHVPILVIALVVVGTTAELMTKKEVLDAYPF
jgi:hypothetical protein